MNKAQFEQHVQECKSRIGETLTEKAKQYRRNDNPFHNFDKAAEMNWITAERALMGMMAKHEVSIRDIVDDIDNGKHPSIEMLSEKIGDNINYLILLEGIIKRRLGENETKIEPKYAKGGITDCLLYTSDAADDLLC